MIIKKLTLNTADFPEVLQHIPSPPRQLYVAGAPLEELLKRPRVAIVGARKITPYGKQVTLRLAGELSSRGIVIVSGLALGVDATAHQATLEAGGQAIAVLPSPLEKIVPATNRPLARQILDQGGALVSEYGPDDDTYKQNFIARNRLVSGLADALLIPEAAEKSGSLHTARFALEQGKEVLAVPGNITLPSSVGTNNLLKQGYAALVTSYQDVLHDLGITDTQAGAPRIQGRNQHEQKLLDLLYDGVSDGFQLLAQSKLSVSEFNQSLTMLEISGKIYSLSANHWSIV
ncbi:MAG TPA: DNA-processing protein DprA [Candidatus Saccharimonadales bacterium]|nr:DNA-processing protein DprA [Candidatus Saccharimonadales bacterium]